MSASNDRLINTAQAAEILGLSHNTLNQWRSLRRGPRFHKIGKSVRYSEAELQQYLDGTARDGTTRQRLQTY